jgi:fructose-1-phosphate kinase PfkB-like protein
LHFAFPIGAGDAVSAGILASWMHFKRSLLRLHEEASVFSFGLACGSASCLQPENSVFDVKDAIQLFSRHHSL